MSAGVALISFYNMMNNKYFVNLCRKCIHRVLILDGVGRVMVGVLRYKSYNPKGVTLTANEHEQLIVTVMNETIIR